MTSTRPKCSFAIHRRGALAARRMWEWRGGTSVVACDLTSDGPIGWQVTIIARGQALTSYAFHMRSDAERFAEEQRLAILAWVAGAGYR